jgi:hypothetical protein
LPNSFRKVRITDVTVASILVLLVCLAGTGFSCCRWCHERDRDVVEHQLFIKAAGTGCEIVDGGGAPAVTVKRGEWAVWTNQLGRDVKLEFPDVRLFGVQTAMAYSQGAPLKLLLRDDAQEGQWQYKAVDVGTGLPGPIIIVPPPDGP